MNLHWFGEEGAGAPAAAAESGSNQTAGAGDGPIQQGDTLRDGTKVPSAQVAAAMEKQMQRHPELRQVYGKGQAVQQAQGGQQDAANDAQARWEQLKKGEFAEQYGQDVQKAIKERFKNQADLKAQLDRLEPALKVLRERAGVEDNEDLVATIMDDDSIYEEEASEMGMTVDAYRAYQKLQEEHNQRVQEQEEFQRREALNEHYMKLANQVEALKNQFPNINLDQELQNPTFLKLTSPQIGLSVEDAYFAVHHKDLGPQMMAYGMQRARNQMAQTIMANGSRPREGGLNNQQQAAADMKINPRAMSRKERDAIRAQVHAGKRGITFD